MERVLEMSFKFVISLYVTSYQNVKWWFETKNTQCVDEGIIWFVYSFWANTAMPHFVLLQTMISLAERFGLTGKEKYDGDRLGWTNFR